MAKKHIKDGLRDGEGEKAREQQKVGNLYLPLKYLE
jgi:hypothetical protein